MHLHPSTKSDHYLTLCLEQAALSPLNYRHGAVIVKGGKVIGAGFNDYRPGFNSGALKTGVLAAGGADGGGGAAPKKNKTTPATATAGASLSMHSEMMAIHAALGSKAAASVRGSIKGARAPSRVAVEEYVEAVLRAAMPPSVGGATATAASASAAAAAATAATTAGAAAASLHERGERTELATGTGWRGGKGAKNGWNAAPVSRQNKQQQQSASRQQSGNNHHRKTNNGGGGKRNKSPLSRSDTSGGDDDASDSEASSRGSGQQSGRRRAAEERRARQQRNDDRSASRQRSPPAVACHVPKAKRSVLHRMRHPRLAGADLYVARLGKPQPACHHRADAATVASAASDAAAADAAAKTRATTTTTTGSLHDELISKEPKPPSPCASPGASSTSGRDAAAGRVAESRPCYRCIAYMHAVGIKRVFWTNGDGVWEGAKVRDLMDSLEVSLDGGGGGGGGNSSGGNGVGSTGSGSGGDFGMFVTKHEVLLLLRALADG